MALVKPIGNPVNTSGDLPAVGTAVPDFALSGPDLSAEKVAELFST